MKAKLILIAILMTVIPILSSAQTQSGDDGASTNPPAAADSLLPDPGPTTVPAGPGSLGPQDVLQEYQTVMVAITQNFTANLAGITEAVQEGKMSSEEGKTSTAEQYLIAKMQFQLLSAWREMDKQDQAKAPAPDDKSDASPTDDNQMGRERHNMEPLFAQLRSVREKLLALDVQHSNKKDIKTLADEQAALLARFIVANARMQSEIYKLLTPQQQRKLDDLKRSGESGTVASR
jgi:Spy/CpxP family protein refolding chaperone